jgi:hypothetical protein
MKVERGRIAEALRSAGHPEAAEQAHATLPPTVDTDEHRERLVELGLDPDELLDQLGRGGLGKMIGG